MIQLILIGPISFGLARYCAKWTETKSEPEAPAQGSTTSPYRVPLQLTFKQVIWAQLSVCVVTILLLVVSALAFKDTEHVFGFMTIFLYSFGVMTQWWLWKLHRKICGSDNLAISTNANLFATYQKLRLSSVIRQVFEQQIFTWSALLLSLLMVLFIHGIHLLYLARFLEGIGFYVMEVTAVFPVIVMQCMSLALFWAVFLKLEYGRKIWLALLFCALWLAISLIVQSFGHNSVHCGPGIYCHKWGFDAPRDFPHYLFDAPFFCVAAVAGLMIISYPLYLFARHNGDFSKGEQSKLDRMLLAASRAGVEPQRIVALNSSSAELSLSLVGMLLDDMKAQRQEADLRLLQLMNAGGKPAALVSMGGQIAGASGSAISAYGGSSLQAGRMAGQAFGHAAISQILRHLDEDHSASTIMVTGPYGAAVQADVTPVTGRHGQVQAGLLQFDLAESVIGSKAGGFVDTGLLTGMIPLPGEGESLPPEVPLAQLPSVICLPLTGRSRHAGHGPYLFGVKMLRCYGTSLMPGMQRQILFLPHLDHPLDESWRFRRKIELDALTKADPLAEAWPQVAEFIGGSLLVGYHMRALQSLIQGQLQQVGQTWNPSKWLCLAEMSNALYGKTKLQSLQELARRVGLPVSEWCDPDLEMYMMAHVHALHLRKAATKGLITLEDLLQLAEAGAEKGKA